jgi:hypothetical protein
VTASDLARDWNNQFRADRLIKRAAALQYSRHVDPASRHSTTQQEISTSTMNSSQARVMDPTAFRHSPLPSPGATVTRAPFADACRG